MKNKQLVSSEKCERYSLMVLWLVLYSSLSCPGCGRFDYEVILDGDSETGFSTDGVDTQTEGDSDSNGDDTDTVDIDTSDTETSILDTETETETETTDTDLDTGSDSGTDSGTDFIPQPCIYRVDMDAPVGIRNGLTWETAFHDVQSGIDAAAEAGQICQVWVGDGVYRVFEGSQIDTIQLASNVNVYGGFGGYGQNEQTLGERDLDTYVAVLDGEGSVYHVVTGKSLSLLDGFTITGGVADGVSLDEQRGGGLYCNGQNMNVANCTFSNNNAVNRGGGVYLATGVATFVDCRFVQNTAGNSSERGDGAGASVYNGTFEFQGCVFENNGGINVEYGAALYNNGGTVIINDCMLSDNTAPLAAGTVYGLTGSLDIKYSIFQNNSTSQGAAVRMEGGNIKIAASLVSGNSGTTDSGFYISNAAVVLENCTVAHNNGVPFVNDNCPSVLVRNSIFYNPIVGHPEIIDMGSTSDVAYSLIAGGLSGEGNLDVDPRFVNPPSDLQLSVDSLCIDAANGDYSPLIDLNGNFHYDAPVADTGTGNPTYVDMGAYEYYP